MTAILDAPSLAPSVVTTIDGESRAVQARPDGSWQCPFCKTYNYAPGTYAYSHSGKWDSPCARFHCVAGGDRSEARLQRFREQEAQAAEAKARAAELAAKRAAIHDPVRAVALEFGFAWGCTKTTPGQFYGDEPTMCEASGWDHAEYVAHMRGHGLKSITGTAKIKLRRKPAATLRKLEIDALADIAWTQSIMVYDEYGEPDHIQTAERTGQFWSAGSRPHTMWVLPFESAPWEDGRPAPVELHVSDVRQ